MKFFSKNKISTEYEEAAERLKQARQEKNLKLSNAAKVLNINIKYLEALEKNQLNKLPAGIYGKNFIREYAKFLGLNPQEIIELFGIANDRDNSGDKKGLFVRKTPSMQYFFSLPKIFAAGIIVLLIFICFGYLGVCLKNIIAPPNLAVTNPAGDITINENTIDIQGLTEPEAQVTINGELVLTNSTGYFIKTINLKNGVNTISVTAQKKYSRKNTIAKKILVKS